jgi:hypothetical protein
MSEERAGTIIRSSKGKSDAQVIEEANEIESREQRKSRLAHVLERGILADRARVDLPDHLYGEWIRNDPLSRAEAQALGFEVDTEYAPKRGLHSDGSGAAVMGDVVFVTIPMKDKELIDEIRSDRIKAINSKPKGREEEELETNVRAATGGDIGTFSESSIGSAGATEISDAIEALRKQQRPGE